MSLMFLMYLTIISNDTNVVVENVFQVVNGLSLGTNTVATALMGYVYW